MIDWSSETVLNTLGTIITSLIIFLIVFILHKMQLLH